MADKVALRTSRAKGGSHNKPVDREFEEVFANHDQLSELADDERELLVSVLNLSPFLGECLRKEPEFILDAFKNGFETALKQEIQEVTESGKSNSDEATLSTVLRIAKRRVALLCGIADLGSMWHASEITKALSDFARAALAASLDFILLKAHISEKLVLSHPSEPQKESGLIVLGMGKFGADELNYSSDIDVILIFDERAKIKLLTDDPVSLLVRLGKQLVKLMQERTSDGYVFRTDLRLRPDPSSTPIIIPVEAALNYYEGQGQNWERAAMIKAMPVAGDIVAGERFLNELSPFVWRKYLDFAAIQDVHSIKRQIHAHKGHGDIAVAGHNVKLGRGGIREIEFFVQTQQLIAGGRNPSLRVKKTVSALAALAEQGWIEPSTAKELTDAYWFLRGLEHRLQMFEDKQTHTLPDTKSGLAHVAHMFGMTERKFTGKVEQTLGLVERHYSELFEKAPELSGVDGNLVFTGHDEDPGTIETLSSMGFERPGDVIRLVKSWHVAKMPALQAGAARELLTELVPDLLLAFSKSSSPDTVLNTFDRFISGLPAGIQLFSILKSNPALNALLVRILVSAPAMAEQISQKPHVFDAMLEPQFEEDHFSRATLEDALSESLAGVSGYEMKLDQARRFFRETRFQIACQFLSGSLNHINCARNLSNLAEAMIACMYDVVSDEFSVQHGIVPGSSTCILAMGRLGSRELTMNSDLDLIFLYDFPDTTDQSSGDKPLDPTLYFIRLIKRFIAAMSAPTAEGLIFQLDFRLRPSGNAGPLATQIEGFLKYQETDAWIWEAQALSRARIVLGDEALTERLETKIPEILQRHKDEPTLEQEIFNMRIRIEEEKGKGDVWNLKTGSGGFLDIEFIAQWLVLKHGAGIAQPTGTLEVLVELGSSHLEPSETEALLEAFDTFSSVLHLQRTCLGDRSDEGTMPDGFNTLLCSVLDLPDLATCEAHLAEMKKSIRKIFNRILGMEGKSVSQI